MSSINLNYRISRLIDSKESNPTQIDREQAFQLVLWDLFSRATLTPPRGEVVISGYVLPDGKGDYFHMTRYAKALKKKFPGLKIRLIAISSKVHQDQLPILKKEVCETHLAYHQKNIFLAPMVDTSPFQENVFNMIGEAAIWISGPIGIENLFDDIDHIAKKRGIAISEYDSPVHSTGKDFPLKIRTGLGSRALGVFVNALKPDRKWENLRNERLKAILFDRQDLSNRPPFFCYVPSHGEAIRFICKAAQFAHVQGKPDQPLDICYLAKEEVDKMPQHFTSDQLKELESLGIGAIQFIPYQKEQHALELGAKGTLLRIIETGPLEPKDFNLLMQLSAPLIGCTGDHALIRALSYGKIPSYEAGTHKRTLIQSVYLLAKERLGQNSPYVEFINKDFMKDSVRDILQRQEELMEDAKTLGAFIRDHFSLSPLLQGIVNERLYRQLEEKFDAETKAHFLVGNLSIKQAEEALKEKLKPLLLT